MVGAQSFQLHHAGQGMRDPVLEPANKLRGMGDEQVLAGVAGLVMGFLCLVQAVTAWRTYRLYTRGEWIEADVVDVREEREKGGDSSFYPVVAFTPPDGRLVRVESPFPKSGPPGPFSFPDAFPDGKVRVLYDPVRPRRIVLSGYRGDKLAISIVNALALAAATGYVFVAIVF
ncbi:hypothetical protein ADK57_45405 [Streptomyces sp. MMG1533]|uniref:DUF3592 domain-containing protein n=1 Tax=Streptomyces sp. MMG1533 TaxID=1415546 RepID=UPI0006AF4542|nr:DUF3592 domain-containing protein [Streptomyces sp. MMG1533]KOU55159.1 hypothetical protein ADK57_45405 [Streptomyces sp. MMG1533]